MSRLRYPMWISGKHGRWGLGIEFTCPHCPERLRVYFSNPCDGFRKAAPFGAPLYHCHGTGLGTLSVSPELEMGKHGRFEILRGEILYRLH